jgi:hypothetical protein
MTLARELEQIVNLSEQVSQKTKNQAMKEVIEHYVNRHNSDQGILRDVEYPLLMEVIAGKTTFTEKYESMEENEFCFLEGNFDLIGSPASGLEKSVYLIDETITNLYHPER